MKVKKLPYIEGTWFAIPLLQGGFGVGVVARAKGRGKVILAYFYGPWRATIPKLAEVENYKPQDAIRKIRVGNVGLVEGNWPIIGRSELWKRSEWPMPVFIRRALLGHAKAWAVYYSDANPRKMEGETPVSPRTGGLEEDGSYGDKATQKLLTYLLHK